MEKQWYHKQFSFDSVINKYDFDNNIVVAILDSGVEAEHLDLKGSILNGNDFINNDEEPNDVLGHGTKMAGIIGARIDNGFGINGIAPNVKILPIKIIENEKTDVEMIIKGLEYAIDKNVDIISISAGTYEYSQSLESVVSKAIDRGITIISSVGNDRRGDIMYPAKFNSVISVGSVNPNNIVSAFSNYGKEIDIVAPGEDIVSTGPLNQYYLTSGTSVSASMVTGLVSLMLGIDNKLAPIDIDKILKETSCSNGVWNENYGFGIINPVNSLEAVFEKK